MSRRPLIPEQLAHGPFTRARALEAGLTSRQLQGSHFRQLFPRVWVLATVPITAGDWIAAASLAMPAHAQLSHRTRIQALGYHDGPLRPFHFTVASELHIDLEDIFLHRTVAMPPLDGIGVSPASAFIGLASTARVIDLIAIGDWLLHEGHMTLPELRELARHQRWRPGAAGAMWVSGYLNARSRSPKESETRAVLVFAGLPVPEVNPPLLDDPNTPWTDLLYRRWRLAVEYEGDQHLLDRRQYNTDIARYAWMRDSETEYVQVTKEMLRQPRALVLRVSHKLVERGYDGPPPLFGARWQSLFEPIRPVRHRGGEFSTSSIPA